MSKIFKFEMNEKLQDVQTSSIAAPAPAPAATSTNDNRQQNIDNGVAPQPHHATNLDLS